MYYVDATYYYIRQYEPWNPQDGPLTDGDDNIIYFDTQEEAIAYVEQEVLNGRYALEYLEDDDVYIPSGKYMLDDNEQSNPEFRVCKTEEK